MMFAVLSLQSITYNMFLFEEITSSLVVLTTSLYEEKYLDDYVKIS